MNRIPTTFLLLLALAAGCANGGRGVIRSGSPDGGTGGGRAEAPTSGDTGGSTIPASAPMSAPAAGAGWPDLAPLPSGEEDFLVRFDQPGRAIPPGLVTGLNDLQNASEPVWKAWGEALQPQGGVMRLWLKYYLAKGVNETHIAAAKMAQAQGLDIFFTVVGDAKDLGRPGVGSDSAVLAAPDDVPAWCRKVVADVDKLRKEGIEVAYLEIWNEPDLPKSWDGTLQEYADFFAEAGPILRRELPRGIKLGGPGLASGWGNGMDWIAAMTKACARTGFKPDFLSWHHYGSFATDSEVFETAERIQEYATREGLPRPEPILSEWNTILPRPAEMSLDDHRGAVFYVAKTAGLMYTPTTHSLFFFLQDGNWEANNEYAGESVGVFTLIGGPKSVLAGMRMMREIADQPLVPRQRWTAPMNLTMAATRSGDRGYLVAANSPGIIEKGIRKFLDWKGMDLALLKNKERQMQGYMRGRAKFSSLGLPAQWEPVMEEARARLERLSQEARDGDRWVSFKLEGAPKGIARVRVIDAEHGNPLSDEGFQRAFAPYRKGLNQAAMTESLEELRRQGVSSADVAKVEEAFRDKKQSIPGVSNQVRSQARAAFSAATARIQRELPGELIQQSATFPEEVQAASWARLQGDILRLRVPPQTAVLVDLVW